MFLDILCDRYNKGIRYDAVKNKEDMQLLINHWIHDWVIWDEEIEHKEVLKEFRKQYKPKTITKWFKDKQFNMLWLNYWPKFIKVPIKHLCHDCAVALNWYLNKTCVWVWVDKCNKCGVVDYVCDAYHDYGIDEQGNRISNEAFRLSNSI